MFRQQYTYIVGKYIINKKPINRNMKLSKARQLYVRSYKGKQYTSYNRVMLNDLIISLKLQNK